MLWSVAVEIPFHAPQRVVGRERTVKCVSGFVFLYLFTGMKAVLCLISDVIDYRGWNRSKKVEGEGIPEIS